MGCKERINTEYWNEYLYHGYAGLLKACMNFTMNSEWSTMTATFHFTKEYLATTLSSNQVKGWTKPTVKSWDRYQDCHPKPICKLLLCLLLLLCAYIVLYGQWQFLFVTLTLSVSCLLIISSALSVNISVEYLPNWSFTGVVSLYKSKPQAIFCKNVQRNTK